MAFTVACAQFSPKKGDLETNLARIADLARQAQVEGADLVLFPETAVSGYFLEGGVLENSLTAEDLVKELEPRLGGVGDLDLCVGFYEKHEGNLYNSAAYIEWIGGRIALKQVYRKFFLPTYGVFDEERFVSRGVEAGVFETRFGKMGILICEDVWHSILPTIWAQRGAQVMLVPSASPAKGFHSERPSTADRYERLLRGISEEHGVFCVNTQLTGFEGGKGFLGGSTVIDPEGRVLAAGPINEEHLLLAPIDLDLVAITRAHLPLLSDLQSSWTTLRSLMGEP
ncbi:MAG TPA: nitrilase-related carbon-nitrogen hydrolase [Fimbriimonadaceae bacterium]|nr:nitrilase-related carbon-nitrogen hydrolase [Fimbriimonadaceae bacterium]